MLTAAEPPKVSNELRLIANLKTKLRELELRKLIEMLFYVKYERIIDLRECVRLRR